MNIHAKSETINLRASPEQRDLIDRAAQATGKSRTQFILDSARSAAEEALLDRRWLLVDEATYQHFLASLDEPPSNGLKDLMTGKAPWET